MTSVSEEIERLTSALRENSMNIRMMPIRGTFEKFRRLVHDLARDLDKEVELTIEGADTELDKSVIEQLGDPLMHLIRNSMDHGIEPAGDRVAQGKPPDRADSTIRAVLGGQRAGFGHRRWARDRFRGGARACHRQRPDCARSAAIRQRSLRAHLSAGIFDRPQVTDVSGRGVGMDVVRQRVDSLRGTIDVASKPGCGTTVTMRLPLTMAIIDGLLVTVGEGSFVLPMAARWSASS